MYGRHDISQDFRRERGNYAPFRPSPTLPVTGPYSEYIEGKGIKQFNSAKERYAYLEREQKRKEKRKERLSGAPMEIFAADRAVEAQTITNEERAAAEQQQLEEEANNAATASMTCFGRTCKRIGQFLSGTITGNRVSKTKGGKRRHRRRRTHRRRRNHN